MIFKNYYQIYKWHIVGLTLLFFVVFINLFPDGYIILGGDIVQPIRMLENFSGIHYDSFGRASLFYGIFYFLDKIGVSDTMQLSWYLGIFLLGSYLSFLVFCRLVLPMATGMMRMLCALFYATNVYTLYIFTATWGYSSYQILYIFVPVLTGLYIRYLETKKNLYAWLFLLAIFLTSTSFGNPAFALSLGIYFFILTGALFLFSLIRLKKDILKRITLLGLGAVFLNVYWILPLIPQMQAGIQEVSSSEVVNLSERLRKTSNAISDTMRLMPTSEQNRYYPVNFPYNSFSWMEKFIVLLAFIPFFIVLIGYIQKRSERERRLNMVFFTLFVVFIALVARVRAPFEVMNDFLFQLPGLNTLRGYDKLATFTPFLLSTLLLLSIIWIHGKKYSKIVLLGLFSLIIALSLPFYAGGLQTKMSYILSSQKKKDFYEAKQSALVKIPDPYYAVAPVFEADTSDYKISMLPFSPGSSIGRVNFPTWKVNGPHPARFLYSKPYVELTEPYVPGWMFAEDFGNVQIDPQWITDFYGLIGIKYVLYHKDAKPKSIDGFENSRKYLENIGALQNVDDNESFTLYRIDENRLFPYIYATEKQDVFIKPGPDGFSEKVKSLRDKMFSLNYEKLDAKNITVTVDRLANKSHVFLNERYDSLWRAQYIASTGETRMLERDENVKYANAWSTQNKLSGGKIEIYYLPLKLFSVGQWVSGVALSVVIVSLISALYNKITRKRENL